MWWTLNVALKHGGLFKFVFSKCLFSPKPVVGHVPPVIDADAGNACPVDDKENLSV